jgi:polyisoprenoid-binding protein YceI
MWSLALAALVQVAELRAEPRRFALDPGSSTLTIHVGRAGLFGFLGHDHVVEARLSEGLVVADPDDLAGSSVQVVFEAADLVVTDPEGPEQDIPEVQAKMQGPDVLDVTAYTRIAFTSTRVSGERIEADAWRLEVVGELELHGVTRRIALPVAVRLVEHGLAVAGELELKQSDWGSRPVSIAGVVKVKDELRIRFEIQGRPE